MKKIMLLLSALMMAALVSTPAFAANRKEARMHTYITHVVKIDAAAGTITFRGRKHNYTLKAEKQLMAGIADGDRVKIQTSGGILKSIKKLESRKIRKEKHHKVDKAPAAPPAAPPAAK